jgi:hypothetical protein
VTARNKESHHINVRLIYQKFPDTFWSFAYALRFIGKKAAFPPLALFAGGALLPYEFQKLGMLTWTVLRTIIVGKNITT